MIYPKIVQIGLSECCTKSDGLNLPGVWWFSPAKATIYSRCNKLFIQKLRRFFRPISWLSLCAGLVNGPVQNRDESCRDGNSLNWSCKVTKTFQRIHPKNVFLTMEMFLSHFQLLCLKELAQEKFGGNTLLQPLVSHPVQTEKTNLTCHYFQKV